jgi:DNA helicase-2/ATP-dependent DNA helicase PcrA
VAPGITVDGRINLITSLDTGETSIVDFKSTKRAQTEDITRDQLCIYAVGFQELTGQRADVLEVLNFDQKGRTTRELVNDSLLAEIRDKITEAGEELRANQLPAFLADARHARTATWSASEGIASDCYRSFYRTMLR